VFIHYLFLIIMFGVVFLQGITGLDNVPSGEYSSIYEVWTDYVTCMLQGTTPRECSVMDM